MPDQIGNVESLGGQRLTEEECSNVGEEEGRLRILLVEDSPTNQLIATMNLEQAGYVVEVVDNGRKAVQALDERGFDLVLMDVYMPEMSGLEATRAIRQGEKGSGQHTPILGMTATDTQEHRKECLEAGMDGFVSKPVTSCELCGAITLLLSRSRDSEGEGLEGVDVQNAPSVDLDEALMAVDGEMGLLRHVVEMFLEEYGVRIEALKDAVAKQDAMGVESTACELGRVLGNVGGLTACDLAYQLESMGESGRLDDGETVLRALETELACVVAVFSQPGWDQGELDCKEG